MSLLLTHGYFLNDDPAERRIMKPYAPLGILAIAAYLKSRGVAVDVFDSTFASMDEFVAHLQRTRPGVVGIYVNLMTKFNVLAMIRHCRAAGARVILGGPEPAPYAAEYLAHGADVIVEGEGELTMEELLPALAQRGPHQLHDIAGIHFLDERADVVRTPSRALIADLDTLPFPDRSAIDLQKYLDVWKEHHGASSLSLICARGCPYHCTWCSHAVYGETHRRFSPARMADEARMLVDAYHPDRFWYADDVFTIHHKWLVDYAAALKARGVRVPFECISRADRLTEGIMDVLQEMGCVRLWIGSESGSQRVLDAMRREVTVGQVQWATHELQRRGIEVGMFIMVGYDGEDESDIAATVEHVRQAAPDIMLSTVAYPIYGTVYYDRVRNSVKTSGGWETRSDRDATVRGRHSRRYYDFAQRWLRGTHELQRAKKHPAGMLHRAKALVNVRLGKLGMVVTRSQREG